MGVVNRWGSFPFCYTRGFRYFTSFVILLNSFTYLSLDLFNFLWSLGLVFDALVFLSGLFCLMMWISCSGWRVVIFLLSLNEFLLRFFKLQCLFCADAVAILRIIFVFEWCSIMLLIIDLCVMITVKVKNLFFDAILIFIVFIFTNLFVFYNDSDDLSVKIFVLILFVGNYCVLCVHGLSALSWFGSWLYYWVCFFRDVWLK